MAGLLLVALFAAQAAQAMHRDQHQFSDTGEQCATCAHTDKSSNGLAPSSAPAALPASLPAAIAVTVEEPDRPARRLNPAPRGPPIR